MLSMFVREVTDSGFLFKVLYKILDHMNEIPIQTQRKFDLISDFHSKKCFYFKLKFINK